MFTQDKNDDFDWTRHSAATRDTKYTPNTGPSGDRSGSKQGKEFFSKNLSSQHVYRPANVPVFIQCSNKAASVANDNGCSTIFPAYSGYTQCLQSDFAPFLLLVCHTAAKWQPLRALIATLFQLVQSNAHQAVLLGAVHEEAGRR